MEEEKKELYPLGEFEINAFPSPTDVPYMATEEELIKLRKHELKWSSEEYEATEDILDDEGNLTGQRQITKTRPILIPNDPTEENERNEAIIRISELKKYLSDTDYIVTKIAEAETEEEKNAIRTEYAEEIRNRKAARSEINAKEAIADDKED